MVRCLIALGVVCLLSAPATAQTLYVMDGAAGAVTQQESIPGGPPCAQPNPLAYAPWGYVGATACPPFVAAPGPTVPPPGGILGDLAVDRFRDVVFVTDGFAVGEYTGDPACAPGGTPLSNWPVPPILTPPGTFMGPLTGMGFDSAAATLWVTDGLYIAGLGPLPSPPGTCAPPGIVVPAFAHGIPGGPVLTDVTWDPASGTLWACGVGGGIHNIAVGGGPASPSFLGLFCGLAAPLQGIAWDLATPGVTGGAPALYVTDGAAVAYIDLAIGGPPAVGPFYTPISCGAAVMPTNGLAYAAGGITYGTPRFAMTIDSTGQSSSPGPSFGFDVTGTPPGTILWLVANFSAPGPGFFCPPIASAGTTLWVSPFAPAIITPLFAAPPTCVTIPAAIPGAIPPGINIFVQMVAVDPITGVARDATSGLEFTITAP